MTLDPEAGEAVDDQDLGLEDFADLPDEADTPDEEQPEEDEGADLAADQDDQPEADEDDPDADLSEGDKVLVTLSDGDQVKLEELKAGYFRQKDYTHKTEELAREREQIGEIRKAYDQQTQALQAAQNGLAHYMQGLVPPEPDLSLAQTNPGQYQYQQAMRQQAMVELQRVLQASQQTQAQATQADAAELARYKSDEEARLIQAMPSLKDPGRRSKFQADVRQAALDFGFSEAEIDTTLDHRILRLVHFARHGKQALDNRSRAARRAGERPSRGKRAPGTAAAPQARSKAMERLTKTGDIEDAVAAMLN